MSFLLSLIGIHLLSIVLAHPGCGSPRPRKEELSSKPVEIVRRQTEASWANITDPTAECAWYSYAPWNDISDNYPAPYTIANVLTNDTTASSIYRQISQSVSANFPNDQPRGTPAGDFSGVAYPSSDPDCWWTYQGCTTPAANSGLMADVTSVPEPNTWGLTFDDGPLCSHNEFYDFLQSNNQKATMFYIGSNVASYPLQALRGLDDGHHICVHTWSHQYMTSLTTEQAFAELYYGRQIIKDLLGVTPKCWRPPYGDVDNRIRAIAQGLNLTTMVWDEDTADWNLNVQNVPAATQAMVDANYESFINMSKNGHWDTYGPVVLSHELGPNTVGEAMKYYPQMKATFSHIVPLASAFNETQPYVEDTIYYPTFAQYIAGQTNQSSTDTSQAARSSSTSALPTASSAVINVAAQSSIIKSGSASSAAASSSISATSSKVTSSSATSCTAPMFMLLAMPVALTLIL